MKRLLLPAIATLLAVVSLVALSGWNRSDAPRLRLTLTERELSLPYISATEDEDLGLQLRLLYAWRFEPLDARNWLTEERLRALGFALDVPPGAPEAREAYERALPRLAWVAFEYGGEAWRAIERQRALERERQIQMMPEASRHLARTEETRLVPVDADLDLDRLLMRYPHDHLIVRASIELGLSSGPNPIIYGRIRHLVPSQIAVPRRLRGRLGGLSESPAPADAIIPPRYEVDVALGRLGVPYISDVRQIRK
jgi:Domain of unknown function (DUF4824)